MTVFELESALVEFIAMNTAELRFRSNEQTFETIAPRVYSGYIPRDEVGAIIPGEITVYPAIIVSAQNGVQDLDCETVTVNITIGCFDGELDQQGYRDCCNLLQRLKDRFRETDILRERFPLSKDHFLLNWQMNKKYGGRGEVNSYPYFFAEMQITFELPVPESQFELATWDGDVTPGRYNQTPIPTEPPLEHDKHPVPPPIKWVEIVEAPTGGIAQSIGATAAESNGSAEEAFAEKEPLRVLLSELIEMDDR
jgi:hypothetical protein